MLAYAGVLHFPRWCRQKSHVTCPKTRWQSMPTLHWNFPIGSDDYSYRKNMVISKRDWKHMYFVIFCSSSWQSDCVIFHHSNSNRLIYSGVLQKAQILLVLDGCSGVLRILKNFYIKSAPAFLLNVTKSRLSVVTISFWFYLTHVIIQFCLVLFF